MLVYSIVLTESLKSQ